MRKYGKVDANQPLIVNSLNKIPGVKVKSTASLGNGFPDICVGYRGKNYLFEIKDPRQSESKRKLTELENDFHETWAGQCDVILTLDEALIRMGLK